MEAVWRQSKSVNLHLAYWSAYLLVFSMVEGIPANAFGTAFLSEVATLLPKIVFVTIVVAWLTDHFAIERKPASFCFLYLALLVIMAFVLRLVDNYIVIPYLLPHWHQEPLLSAAPFLYNAIKLQFLVTIPFIVRLVGDKAQGLSAAGVITTMPVVERAGNRNEYLHVICDRRTVHISLADVRYFETRGNHILIYTANDCLKTYLSVSKLQEQLADI